jgi:hypothetical protein
MINNFTKSLEVEFECAEDCRREVKCILLSFSKCLRFRAFTVAIFHSFLTSFLTSFLLVYCQITENELKMRSKMSRKWPKNANREQPYYNVVRPTFGSILIGVKDTDSDSEFEISCAFSM